MYVYLFDRYLAVVKQKLIKLKEDSISSPPPKATTKYPFTYVENRGLRNKGRNNNQTCDCDMYYKRLGT